MKNKKGGIIMSQKNNNKNTKKNIFDYNHFSQVCSMAKSYQNSLIRAFDLEQIKK
ncbi:hypothetical protein ACJA23_01435 [Mycoplasma corogypsi]|uniref:hypothetical protein n=1 Tax=Mycoplasma corogypsi TaxID=2106 RepID=UPI0038738492